MRYWYYYDDADQQKGPISEDAFVKLFQTGSLSSNTSVWTEGMEEWMDASSVEGLVSHNSVPPPIARHADCSKGSAPKDTAPTHIDIMQTPNSMIAKYRKHAAGCFGATPVIFYVSNQSAPGNMLVPSVLSLIAGLGGFENIRRANRIKKHGLKKYKFIRLYEDSIVLAYAENGKEWANKKIKKSDIKYYFRNGSCIYLKIGQLAEQKIDFDDYENDGIDKMTKWLFPIKGK